jgi:uncharacterized RmlC-like cupin family protein
MSHDHREQAPKWKHDGVRVIPGHTLDPNTPQTPGMERKAAINLPASVRKKSGQAR